MGGKGKSHKKRRNLRKTQNEHYRSRVAAAHTHTALFLACHEIILYHFLEACTLSTLIALSHTSVNFRIMVKTLLRSRLRAVVQSFFGSANIESFFTLLEATDSAIGGSTIARVLTPPPSGVDDWLPSNINIFVPIGATSAWASYFAQLRLARIPVKQPNIPLQYAAVTSSHANYESYLHGHPILLTESIDECVITPVVASSTTIGLFNLRRAHRAWYSPSVEKCIKLQDRGYRHSVSTRQWGRECGWNCPVLWRRIQGLKGVGIFCWGGLRNENLDNGYTGLPFTDVSMKWRLGEVCSNPFCRWYSED
ncbi:hypothetical protein C8R45DRAFT_1171755 [Mycena sanguinolenta]|nr:hypothetical protein C8R45DRAFT_1171755 [Mycena sanguinolenta]